MPTATADDVTDEISTDLSNEEITESLERAQEWNEAQNTPANQSTTETKNIEIYRAIINIRQHKERSVSEDSIGSSSLSYEGDELGRAKSKLAEWLSIAGENPMAASSLLRDTNRHISPGRASSADDDRDYR